MSIAVSGGTRALNIATTYHRPPSTPPQKADTPVRFGNVSHAMSILFQPIAEQWIYGFFALDVVALWIPRMIGALLRSRNVYDVKQDPAMQNESPLRQGSYSLYKNTMGLNWANFWEESGREVQTGPCLTLAQSLIFACASAASVGKLSMMMGYQELKTFKSALMNSLREASPSLYGMGSNMASLPLAHAEENVLRKFLNDLLMKGHFQAGLKRTLSLETLGLDDEKDDALRALLQKAYPEQKTVTYEQALQAWIRRWTLLRQKPGQRKQFVQQEETLERAFKRITYWYNRKATDPVRLNQLQIQRLRIPGAPHDYPRITSDEFLEEMRKFRGFVSGTLRQARQQAMKSAHGSPFQILEGASETLFKSLVNRKFGMSVFATVLAGATVIGISAVAQSGKKYPANSKYQLHPNAASADPTAFGGSASFAASTPRVAPNYFADPSPATFRRRV